MINSKQQITKMLSQRLEARSEIIGNEAERNGQFQIQISKIPKHLRDAYQNVDVSVIGSLKNWVLFGIWVLRFRISCSKPFSNGLYIEISKFNVIVILIILHF